MPNDMAQRITKKYNNNKGERAKETKAVYMLHEARIMGWGIRFKLQMLCPQEDDALLDE